LLTYGSPSSAATAAGDRQFYAVKSIARRHGKPRRDLWLAFVSNT